MSIGRSRFKICICAHDVFPFFWKKNTYVKFDRMKRELVKSLISTSQITNT
jgi:hypothetical protein